MEKETKKSGRNLLIGILIAGLLGGVIYYPQYKENKQKEVNRKPTITAKEFEELPVGLIYEYSEEEQKEFLEYAKNTPIEKIPTSNHMSPEESLNDDGSLVNPYSMIGSYESNKNNSHLDLDGVPKWSINFKFKDTKMDLTNEVNKILHYEKYFANGGKFSQYFNNWKWAIAEDIYTSEDGPGRGVDLIHQAIDSGFLNLDKESVTTNLWRMNFFAPIVSEPFDFASIFAQVSNVMPTVNNVDDNWEKYNIADEVNDANTSYYFPTRVWKLDNTTIIVDIQIENGSMLSSYDVSLLAQTMFEKNKDGFNSNTPWGYEEGDFLVNGRFFDSNISQGLIPEFATLLINRDNFHEYYDSGAAAYDVVFNDTAKNLLRDYYKEVVSLIKEDRPIVSEDILKELSEKHNIPFEDAISIWGVHRIRATYDMAYLA